MVTPSRNGDHVTVAAVAVAEGGAQGAHLNLQVRLFDERLRPGSGDQLLLADHLAGAFDQSSQNVKGAAAEPHRLVALEQEPLRCKEPVRAKRDRLSVHGAWSPDSLFLSNITWPGPERAPPLPRLSWRFSPDPIDSHGC